MATGSHVLSIAEQSAHFLSRPTGGRPKGPVSGPSVWRAADLGGPEAWREVMPSDFLVAVEQRLVELEATAISLDDLTADDVSFPGFQELLARWRETLRLGRGFLVLSGAPVERWSSARQKLFVRIMGLQFGRLGQNNPQGDVVGEVRDTGAQARDEHARLYATAGEFRFHCDAADLVGLLCVRPAESGGDSRIASASAVYNELLSRRPDLAARLFEPIPFDLRNEQAAGAAPYAEVAPCAFADGRLWTFYISDYFRSVARHGVTPPLELLDLYDAIADDPAIGLRFQLEAGDMQILNNHAMLHARTAFVDAPGRERLLLRFLVSVGA